MRGDSYSWAGDAEAPSPPAKRLKIEKGENNRVLPSIETLEQGAAPLKTSRCHDDPTYEFSRFISNACSAGAVAAEGLIPHSSTTNASIRSSVSDHSGKSAMLLSEPSRRRFSGSGANTPDPCTSGTAIVDFATAPSDPIDLARWVAQHVQLCCSKEVASMLAATGAEQALRRSSSHMPGVRARSKADEGLDEQRVEQRNKSRDAASSRKRQWRKEKKEINKDNDLRCRINKRAKTIYGKEYSQEKVDFLKAEFATRKAKRIVREKSKRKPSFTGYSMPQVVAAKHFPNASDEVNAAGILLVNTLHIIIHKNAAPSNHVAAFALKSAIDDQEIDNQPFVEALRLLGSDINIMSILSAPLNGQRRQAPTKSSNTLDYPSLPGIATPTTGSPSVGSARSELTPSIGDSTFPIEPRLRLRGGMVTETNGMSESDKILCALNTATEILGNMIEATALFYHPAFAQPTTGYVTPYANSYESPYKTPYPNPDSTQSTKANPSTLSNGLDHSARKSSSSDAMKSNILQHSIDQAKVKATFQVDQALGERAESNVVDDFLRLAGGGSLTDDDAESGTSAENRASRLDIDVEATLNHICKIMENRDSAGKELSEALRSAVAENTVFTIQQSHAVSGLYNTLANCAQSFSRPGRAPVPQPHDPMLPLRPGPPFMQHASSMFPHQQAAGISRHSGPTYPKQAGIFIPHHPGGTVYYHPGGKFPFQPVNIGNEAPITPIRSPTTLSSTHPKPFVPSNMPPPPVPRRIGTARGKTVEEAKKVRDYGFPPLPGSRPGMNSSGTKRKLGE